ncbi:MAG TPA: hypothetical protein VNK04_04820 [Gemmataceae bacterium]|nr:hypothetical protein [Gemmataceae bacterium]
MEIIPFDFQVSAAVWKHADLMVYNALLFAHYHVPVHALILLLRSEAVHANMNGAVRYAARPAEGLLAADLATVARRLVERLE